MNKMKTEDQQCSDLGMKINLDLDKLPPDHDVDFEWDFFLPLCENKDEQLEQFVKKPPVIDNSPDKCLSSYYIDKTEELADTIKKLCLSVQPPGSNNNALKALNSMAAESFQKYQHYLGDTSTKNVELENTTKKHEFYVNDQCKCMVEQVSTTHGDKNINWCGPDCKQNTSPKTLQTRGIKINLDNCGWKRDKQNFIINWLNSDLKCHRPDPEEDEFLDVVSCESISSTGSVYQTCASEETCSSESVCFLSAEDEPILVSKKVICPYDTAQHYLISYGIDCNGPSKKSTIDQENKKHSTSCPGVNTADGVSSNETSQGYSKQQNHLNKVSNLNKTSQGNLKKNSHLNTVYNLNETSQGHSNKQSHSYPVNNWNETPQNWLKKLNHFNTVFDFVDSVIDEATFSVKNPKKKLADVSDFVNQGCLPNRKKRRDFAKPSKKSYQDTPVAISQQLQMTRQSKPKTQQYEPKPPVKTSPDATKHFTDGKTPVKSKVQSSEPLGRNLPFDSDTNALIKRLHGSPVWSPQLKHLIRTHAENVDAIRNISKHIEYIKHSGEKKLKEYVRKQGLTEDMIHRILDEVLTNGENVEDAFQKVAQSHMPELKVGRKINSSETSLKENWNNVAIATQVIRPNIRKLVQSGKINP